MAWIKQSEKSRLVTVTVRKSCAYTERWEEDKETEQRELFVHVILTLFFSFCSFFPFFLNVPKSEKWSKERRVRDLKTFVVSLSCTQKFILRESVCPRERERERERERRVHYAKNGSARMWLYIGPSMFHAPVCECWEVPAMYIHKNSKHSLLICCQH